MKIAIISESFLMGGLETRLDGIFRNTEHEIHLIVQRYTGSNFNTTVTQMKKENIKKALLKLKPDIADIHPFISLTEGAAACIELGIPYVATIHGIYLKPSYTQALENAKVVFATSEEVSDNIKSLTNKANIIILRNGVDLEQFDLVKISDKRKFAIVSRLDIDKYQGIREFLKQYPNADVIGSGTMQIKLQKEFPNAVFLGAKDIPLYFKKHGGKYSVIAGMGRVLLEGLAMGYPVLLVGYDGIKGFVTENNFKRLSYRNFSGRNDPNVCIENISNENLRYLLYDNHDEAKIRKEYFSILENITTK